MLSIWGVSSCGRGSGHRGGLGRGGGLGEGEEVRGRGQGTFPSTCHKLHCHMVLHPKGTLHNYHAQ